MTHPRRTSSSSDRPGGRGGDDIYRVTARIDALYTRGSRLFDEINTPKSDTYAPMLDTRRPADNLRGADLYRVEARVR